MRRLLSFVALVAMLVGGAAAATFELWFTKVTYFRFVVGGGVLALVGAFLLWAVFVAPKVGIKAWEDSPRPRG